MTDQKPTDNSATVGAGTWVRAVISGGMVATGIVFVGMLLPFALGQVLLGVALWMPILAVSLVLGLLLGLATIRQTIRQARRDACHDSK